MEAVMQYRRVGALSSCILVLAGAVAPPAFGQDDAAPSLRSIRRIYVEKMDNDLDQYIRAEIQKKFGGDIVVVLKPDAADAILAGVSEHQNGTRAAVTGRYFGLHDTATGSVSLLDKTGTTVLWSSEAGDRSILFGSMKRGGPRKVADRLINNLKKAME
jgi:hypothetical protein